MPDTISKNKKLLLVDDEKNLLRVVSLNLAKRGFLVNTAISAEEALRLLSNDGYDVIICDLRLGGMSGIELLSKVKEEDKKRDKNTVFIVITAFGTIKQAVEAIKLGADDFISKPVDINSLVETIDLAMRRKNYAKIDNFEIQNGSGLNENIFKDFIFKSSAMNEILNEVKLTSKSPSNVLITGETGTGKEVLAKVIHILSGRSGEFVPINLSAIPEGLMESELFGFERGAFTGAVSGKKGKFETANGGTLFLDEIADMPLSMQVKLLRVIQDKEFSRIGSNDGIKLNAKIISATNIPLENAVIEKKFREDLFYRINVLHFKIPPLRERKEDIIPLANFFVKKYCGINKKSIGGINDSAINLLKNYTFPGNIRELENIIERAVVVCTSDSIMPVHLPKTLTAETERDAKTKTEAERFQYIDSASENLDNEININLDGLEMELIKNALEKNNHNQTKTAASLGITRKRLITKIKKYNLFSDK
jgi:DNA-binding NtrC family response regulator